MSIVSIEERCRLLPALPDPLVPSGIDIRSFVWWPIGLPELLDCRLMVEADESPLKAGLRLMAAACREAPPASLPDDDKRLAYLAGLDVRRWRRYRDAALADWIKCSDGRFYHLKLAEAALDAYRRKRKDHDRTGAARKAKAENLVAGVKSRMRALEKERMPNDDID